MSEPKRNGNGNGISLTVGDKSLSARGTAVVILILWIGLVAANLAGAWMIQQSVKEQTQQLSGEHRVITQMERDQACIMTFSFEERKEHRRKFFAGMYRELCPWLGGMP